MLDALASTGSGTILDKPGDSKGQWIFDTPRGEFTVQSKIDESCLGQARLGLYRGRARGTQESSRPS